MSAALGRRAFHALAASAPLLLLGCDRASSALYRALAGGVPDTFVAPTSADVDPDFHLLSRAAFGPRPGDLERVRAMGRRAYLDEQLDPASIDDTARELVTETMDVAGLGPELGLELPPDQIEVELTRYEVLRATYSKRQLLEVMTEALGDHLHVSTGKPSALPFLPAYRTDVVRKHALGTFRELLHASAMSPAMLSYLDGRENKRRSASDAPNENYARELFELHTLGVGGGYTQQDVMEAARCLTGFVVEEKWAPGRVDFVAERHDDGEKRILGTTIPAGQGARDLEQLLDLVAQHPSTAKRVATKLARTFVCDDPPETAVRSASETFTATGGDLAKTARTLLESDEAWSHRGAKLKRPFRLVVSALRGLGADTHAKGDVVPTLARMGHEPLRFPTPDGYPTRAEAWLGTLLFRFRFASELAAGRLEGAEHLGAKELASRVPGGALGLFAHLVGRKPQSGELGALASLSEDDALALALASPAFQVH